MKFLLSISESRIKFQGTNLPTIQSTGAAKSNNFSTFSTYSHFIFLDYIDILRTYCQYLPVSHIFV